MEKSWNFVATISWQPCEVNCMICNGQGRNCNEDESDEKKLYRYIAVPLLPVPLPLALHPIVQLVLMTQAGH